jgi:glutamate racemase
MSAPSPIGVFDSGIGGLSVLRALVQALPGEHFIYLADSGYAPYGERGDAYVLARSRACALWLIAQGCQMVVVACNTATAAAIATLRAEFPQILWVGIEPALKPAVAPTQNAHVAVLATRGTLESEKFAQLAAQQKSTNVQVSCIPCDGLADAIERDDETAIATIIIAACAVFTPANGQFGLKNEVSTALDGNRASTPAATPTTPLPPADVAVLGCTHYPLVERVWRAVLPAGVTLIDPAQAVARQAARLWQNRSQAAHSPAPEAATQPPAPGTTLRLGLATTGPAKGLQNAVAAHLHPQLAQHVQAVQIPHAGPGTPTHGNTYTGAEANANAGTSPNLTPKAQINPSKP